MTDLEFLDLDLSLDVVFVVLDDVDPFGIFLTDSLQTVCKKFKIYTLFVLEKSMAMWNT
jgi:hypothetical protein